MPQELLASYSMNKAEACMQEFIYNVGVFCTLAYCMWLLHHSVIILPIICMLIFKCRGAF